MTAPAQECVDQVVVLVREPALIICKRRERGGLSPCVRREQPALPLNESDSGGQKLPFAVQDTHFEVIFVVRQLQRRTVRLDDIGRAAACA